MSEMNYGLWLMSLTWIEYDELDVDLIWDMEMVHGWEMMNFRYNPGMCFKWNGWY